MMNPRTDKLVRRTTMVATVTASYFLLTADYGSEPNALDPVKKAIKSAENSVKGYIFGPNTQSEEVQVEKLGSDNNIKKQP
ncbi:uncharacterized protein LOC115706536 [Cannabis sativa]|uniref:Uncharacterized protein n=1 Tax=Cannabis sativa TaxID=3483 RepID=A0A7J6HC92_CANSA|nr:uncharacterized protein LOC115706536 [Cannabis sativa]KAF4386720.1 hypothetical protein F8388_006675 [Cannabis sativa]KAF4392874.1 hypothetical protein G4B88_011869 [Cannabis sativa]